VIDSALAAVRSRRARPSSPSPLSTWWCIPRSAASPSRRSAPRTCATWPRHPAASGLRDPL